MGTVVVIGSFNVDHVWDCDALPAAGATIGGRYRSGPGGKGFNQAVAARRAGADTHFICALGDDAGGELARTLAAGDGIALHARTVGEPTGTAGIYVSAEGHNSIVVGAGANAALTAAFVGRHGDTIGDAAVLLAQLEIPSDGVRAALQLASQSNTVRMLNPAPANAAIDAALLRHIDILTPNETEFAALLERHTGQAAQAHAITGLDDDALHRLCRALLPDGSVVVTLGAAGCFVSHPDTNLRGDDRQAYRLPASPADPVDTTGAGDAFNGALAAGLALRPDSPLREHLRFAGVYAARSTERPGAADAMPHLSELRICNGWDAK